MTPEQSNRVCFAGGEGESGRGWLLAIALWLVLVVFFFRPIIFQGMVLAPLDILEELMRPWGESGSGQVHNAFVYDAISQYLPYDWSVFQSLRQDGHIGWNPMTHSGHAILQNTMLCPGDWRHQLYRFLPFWTAWNLGIVLQFAIAGLGMLLLLRSQGIPASHALSGAVAFGFCSQFTLWIYHRWVLAALCWTPWIVWAVLRARREKRCLDFRASLFIGLGFRGGHLQTSLFVVLLVMAVALVECWTLHACHGRKKGPIIRALAAHASFGFFGALLALDVWVETLPPFLYGCAPRGPRTWWRAVPTLVTSVFPGFLGTPQSLDGMKVFGSDLFDIKFAGGTILVLAATALFSPNAPVIAKTLFLLGLLLSFSPAVRWLYSRFAPVFALGAGWLASWQLRGLARSQPSAVWWRRWVWVLAAFCAAWAVASVAVTLGYDRIEHRAVEVILRQLPADKSHRSDWMIQRTGVFLRDWRIWSPRNVASIGLIALGLACCSRIHKHNRRASWYAIAIAFLTFGELALFARSWISLSVRPPGPHLYADPVWGPTVRSHMGNGTLFCPDRSDFDYLQLNTPSGVGIRLVQGYDTVLPRRVMHPSGLAEDDHRPEVWAEAGVSAVLLPPGHDGSRFSEWEKVINSRALILYRNPAFTSIYRAVLLDGSIEPVFARTYTAGSRIFDVPNGTKSLELIESYRPGWRYSLDGSTWLPVQSTTRNTIRIDVASQTFGSPAQLHVRYSPPHADLYRPVMASTVLFLLIVPLVRGNRPDSAA